MKMYLVKFDSFDGYTKACQREHAIQGGSLAVGTHASMKGMVTSRPEADSVPDMLLACVYGQHLICCSSFAGSQCAPSSSRDPACYLVPRMLGREPKLGKAKNTSLAIG